MSLNENVVEGFQEGNSNKDDPSGEGEEVNGQEEVSSEAENEEENEEHEKPDLLETFESLQAKPAN